MEEVQKSKPVLEVIKKGSNAVNNARTAILVFAWLSIIVGVITMLCGIEDATDKYYGDGPATLLTGLALALSCIPQFILASIVRGFSVVVEEAEIKKELVGMQYKILEKTETE